MTRATATGELDLSSENIKYFSHLRFFIFGLLFPLGFAPFHLPGMAIIGMAFFYHGLRSPSLKSPLLSGFLFGLGAFGLGTSWVYVSINEYGHLHSILAAFITFLFLSYLSFFPAIVAYVFSKLDFKNQPLYSGLLFSTLWILGEFARASLFSGFPWLLLGVGQFDTPLKFLLPITGVFGSSFLSCFAATLLSNGIKAQGRQRSFYLLSVVGLILFPLLFKSLSFIKEEGKAISVGIIQANLSMRDKWDEKFFRELMQLYQKNIEQSLGTELIVMPESAIPLPSMYVGNFLQRLEAKAKAAGSAILLGIPEPAHWDENTYFNTLLGMGKAKGSYLKQHLVPFGEYIPWPLQGLSNLLGFPAANIASGESNQNLIQMQNHPIASLICYELAYGSLLRQQLPAAHWIVSISEDGWFGHSLAMYQKLQMAQVLALETGRFHVLSNNNGLSSVINTEGKIIDSLPAFSTGILQTHLFAASGSTPWVRFGDAPILWLSFLSIGMIVLARIVPLLAPNRKPQAS